ncbi:MAG: transposase [Phototrophicaceae bacterium]
MDYYPVKQSLQELFKRLIPSTASQNSHISQFCLAMLLADSPNLSRIARHLDHPTQQHSRMQWIRRLLDASYLNWDYVYQPFIRHLLASYASDTFHLIIDRTDLVDHHSDLLSINLNFHRRSIPLVWTLLPNKMSGFLEQKPLIERCFSLIPKDKTVVFHGDNEFGGVPTMQYIRQLGWHYILAQSAKNYYRTSPLATPHSMSTLPVTKSRAVYLQNIEITKRHWYGTVNLFAFYHPVHHRNRRKQEIRYYATSLPLTPQIRRIGKRRWGIECYFKDLKSAGWRLPLSRLRDPNRYESLLILLNLTYSWVTCLGRWLSKTSQRCLVDAKAHRHLSLFRIGWDWLVHTFRTNTVCPVLTTLYQ